MTQDENIAGLFVMEMEQKKSSQLQYCICCNYQVSLTQIRSSVQSHVSTE